MKTVFTSHGHDACSIKYLDKVFDLIENRTFIRRGHHVFEVGLNGTERQLCRNLQISGVTLVCYPTIDLIDVIRLEYRRFIDQQRKTFS
jgi:hypothetical protein